MCVWAVCGGGMGGGWGGGSGDLRLKVVKLKTPVRL